MVGGEADLEFQHFLSPMAVCDLEKNKRTVSLIATGEVKNKKRMQEESYGG